MDDEVWAKLMAAEKAIKEVTQMVSGMKERWSDDGCKGYVYGQAILRANAARTAYSELVSSFVQLHAKGLLCKTDS